MSQPQGHAIRIGGLPWYVAAFECDAGLVALWDGERTVMVETRRHWREGVMALEVARRQDFSAHTAEALSHLALTRSQLNGP